MNSKLKSTVKSHLKVLKAEKSGKRGFYFVTDGEESILYISGENIGASAYGEITKINKHVARKKFGEAFPPSASAVAGTVTLKDGVLNFAVKIKRGGANATVLKSGIRAVKSSYQIKKYAIADVVEDEPSHDKAPRRRKKRRRREPEVSQEEDPRQEARLRKLAPVIARFDRDPARLSDSRLEKLAERMAKMKDHDFGGLPRRVLQEQKRRTRLAKRLSLVEQSIADFGADRESLDDARLARLLERMGKLAEQHDFGDTARRVQAEIDRRVQLSEVLVASLPLIDDIAPLSDQVSNTIAQDDVTGEVLDGLMERLQQREADLTGLRDRLQMLMSA